jgi:hypothetical protein
MEFAGFMLLFVGLVYAIYPKINSLWPSKDPEAKKKMASKEYIKTIRVAGLVAVALGAALLVCNFFLN